MPMSATIWESFRGSIQKEAKILEKTDGMRYFLEWITYMKLDTNKEFNEIKKLITELQRLTQF